MLRKRISIIYLSKNIFCFMRRKTWGNVMIQIDLDGEPIPWMRAKPNYRNRCMYDPQKAEKETIRWQMRGKFRNKPFTGPLKIGFTFFFAPPKSTSGPIRRDMINGVIHHILKPDCDNLVKFYLDCMTGVVYEDDRQVCGESGDKLYAESPGVHIEITPLNTNFKKQKAAPEDENDPGDSGW
jgi:Holliday junction resolvase RusA-like endonuclease